MKHHCKHLLPTLVSAPVQWECSLAPHTSFGIGGPAEALMQIGSGDELLRVMEFAAEHGIPLRVLGRGTNILVQDEGLSGIVVKLSGDFTHHVFTTEGDTIWVKAGGGLSLNRLTSLCIEQGAAGMEFAMGIPGTVGGAIRMNAGAWGSSIADILDRVELFSDNSLKEYNRDEIEFGYRSFLIDGDNSPLITFGIFKLRKADPEKLREICREYQKKRKNSQPQGKGNAGSIFKNPQNDSAGRLIELSGFKGEKIGDAEVSPKHANFIVNNGQATAENVLQLIKKIRDRVYEQHGILLEQEVQVW